MRPRGKSEESVGDVLKDLIKIYRVEDKFNELDIIRAWEEVMGKAIVSKTRKIKVKKDVLIVYLDSGVLKEEFSYAKEKLIKLINDQLGKEVIRSVEIH